LLHGVTVVIALAPRCGEPQSSSR